MKKKLVVLSGAGISAESGLGTFRDNGGLWEKYDISEVATPQAWEVNQELVLDFYNQRRLNCLEAEPNEAHFGIQHLETYFDVEIVTQNIDDLHERAGSSKILHLHGEILKQKCSVCNDTKLSLVENGIIEQGDLCPNGHQMRPHVVWFGEDVPAMDEAIEICSNADILLVIGTSLNVYPAANLIYYTPNNCQIFLIDPNNVKANRDYVHIQETATSGISIFTKKILSQKKP